MKYKFRKWMRPISLACLLVMVIGDVTPGFSLSMRDFNAVSVSIDKQEYQVDATVVYQDGSIEKFKANKIPKDIDQQEISMLSIGDKKIKVTGIPYKGGTLITVHTSFVDETWYEPKAVPAIIVPLVYFAVRGAISGSIAAWRAYEHGENIFEAFVLGFAIGSGKGLADYMGVSWSSYAFCIISVAANMLATYKYIISPCISSSADFTDFISCIKDDIKLSDYVSVVKTMLSCF